MRHRQDWTVDRRALFSLLSIHLYPSRLAFLRELVCNAVDAILNAAERDGRVDVRVESREGATWLVVIDNGRGISPTEIGSLIGTIGVSGTKALRRVLEDHLVELPQELGCFGIGLLSCWAAADRVEIDSWRGRGHRGIRWSWSGEDYFEWEECAATVPNRGTRVGLRLRRGMEDSIDEALVRDYVEGEFLLVEAVLRVGGRAVGGHELPWRGDSMSAKSLVRWSRRVGIEGALSGCCVKLPRGGGVIALVPDEHTSWTSELRLHRSGVRVRGAAFGGLVPPDLSWLSVVADFPGCPVTLDRECLTPAGVEEVRSMLLVALVSCVTGIFDDLTRRRHDTAWFERHREDVLSTLQWWIARSGGLTGEQHRKLGKWLPFRGQQGWITLAACLEANVRKVVGVRGGSRDARWFESPASDVAVVEWSSETERYVLEKSSAALGLEMIEWAQGTPEFEGARGQPAYPKAAIRLARVLDGVMPSHEVCVRLDNSFETEGPIARWINPPRWHEPGTALLGVDYLFGEAIGGATLGLNPWSPMVGSLGQRIDEGRARAVGWLLCEIASVAHRAPQSVEAREHRARLHRSLLELVGVREVVHDGPLNCYVAYDWTHGRQDFQAVREAFSAAPFGWKVVDARQQNDRFILENILTLMAASRIYVSILSSRSGVYNPNVLMEAGVAASYRERPHFVCHPRGQSLPSNLQGWLAIPYDGPADLSASVRRTALGRQLDLPGVQRGTGSSLAPVPRVGGLRSLWTRKKR